MTTPCTGGAGRGRGGVLRRAAAEALDEEALDEAFFEALRPSVSRRRRRPTPGDGGGGRDDEDDELKEELGWTTRQRVGAWSHRGRRRRARGSARKGVP